MDDEESQEMINEKQIYTAWAAGAASRLMHDDADVTDDTDEANFRDNLCALYYKPQQTAP